ncbi:SPFH/Band 7/PHB domain protein [Epidermidibacterium keratini]|uniref:SPFH/Band 7/PHB domain protein n=1 Tax=Epidermidibacterium keratini TaxID=1891644 RepID=A0A7L4YS59_9ACTN|nr:SPFH domain-containing protein [Epidermidibacterium keratini]QHC02091.1 SPFH/Band 7/PHB domain protein [Epidermidibacterium keratini]
MSPGVITLIVIAALIVLLVARSVRIVPQAREAVVERLGRFHRVLTPGLNLVVPFVDRVRSTVDLREQVVPFPPQPVITNDNLQVGIDTVIYYQITDARAATYGISDLGGALEQLTVTTLRNLVGSLTLEETLISRDGINAQLRTVLDGTTGNWGVRVARVELKAIEPPPSIQDSMEKQMRADRDKRAMILTAEGTRESQIRTAEGQKQAAILSAEGQKQAAILSAEAERQSRILRAEGERAARFLQAQGQAKAIETVFQAIHDGNPDPRLLAYQYLQTLPQIAQGDSNKVWIVPSEFSNALKGLGKMTGIDEAELSSFAGLSESEGTRRESKIDTGDWFESQLKEQVQSATQAADVRLDPVEEIAPASAQPVVPRAPGTGSQQLPARAQNAPEQRQPQTPPQRQAPQPQQSAPPPPRRQEPPRPPAAPPQQSPQPPSQQPPQSPPRQQD